MTETSSYGEPGSVKILSCGMEQRLESLRRRMKQAMIKEGISKELVDRTLDAFVRHASRGLAELQTTLELADKFEELDKLVSEQTPPVSDARYRPTSDVRQQTEPYELVEMQRKRALLEAENKKLRSQLHGSGGLIQQVLKCRKELELLPRQFEKCTQ